VIGRIARLAHPFVCLFCN